MLSCKLLQCVLILFLDTRTLEGRHGNIKKLRVIKS